MFRFRFFGTYTNARGRTYNMGIGDGYGVHIRGWHAGAKITCRKRGPGGKVDEFDIAMTNGSSGDGRDVHLGTVRETPAGPVWMPAGVDTDKLRELLHVIQMDADQDVVYPDDITDLRDLLAPLLAIAPAPAPDVAVFGPQS